MAGNRAEVRTPLRANAARPASRAHWLATVLAGTTLIAACATPPQPPAPPPAAAPGAKPLPAPVERVAAPVLELQRTSDVRTVELVVRAAAPGEIDSRSFDELRQGLGAAAVVGALGLTEVALLPFSMFSPGVLLGSVVVTVGAAALLSAERAVQERIVRAVNEGDFNARVRDALTPRLARPAPGAAPDATLEVLTLAHGVVENRPHGMFCVFADLQITLRAAEGERYRERVLILPLRRSADAPVPDCRLRDTLAAADRAVIRDALDDYARAMPAILARRLPGLPWRN